MLANSNLLGEKINSISTRAHSSAQVCLQNSNMYYYLGVINFLQLILVKR